MSLTATEQANLDLVTAYLRSLQAGEAGAGLERFFTPDALQQEFPNKLNPAGGLSDLRTILERSERGKQLLTKQSYTVRSSIARGDVVAVEAEWSGTLAVSF